VGKQIGPKGPRMPTNEAATLEQGRLQQLADDINTQFGLARDHWAESVKYAIKVGELLIDAKAAVRHGEWEKWVEDNCPFKIRSAQGYMKAARNKEKAQALAHLGVEKVLKELADNHKPFDEEKQQEKPAQAQRAHQQPEAQQQNGQPEAEVEDHEDDPDPPPYEPETYTIALNFFSQITYDQTLKDLAFLVLETKRSEAEIVHRLVANEAAQMREQKKNAA